MNYLAHGYRFLDDPHYLAGTAVPDWLNVADRATRIRTRHLTNAMPSLQATTRSVAAGMLQHLRDDDLFHRSAEFLMLESEIGLRFRHRMPDPFDHRAGFLGHIVTELLLDAVIAEGHPNLLRRYYAALSEVQPEHVQQTVNQIAVRPTDRLADFIGRFCQSAFLYDYLDDARLLFRLNQVLCRVKLPPIDTQCQPVLKEARTLLRQHSVALLQAVEQS